MIRKKLGHIVTARCS